MKHPEIIIVDRRGATRYRLPISRPVVFTLAAAGAGLMYYFFKY
jgi:hypothetical protein